jgi:hypothetical protein
MKAIPLQQGGRLEREKGKGTNCVCEGKGECEIVLK